MRLVVYRCTEAVKADSAEDDNYDHQDQAELWLIHTLVALGKLEADPVVQGAGDAFADDAENLRAAY